MKQIALLGTGAMSFRIAQNLLSANYPVSVYNRTVEKVKPLLDQGASHAATPREAAEQADLVISMVAKMMSRKQSGLTRKQAQQITLLK